MKATLPQECSPDCRAPDIRLRPRRAFGFTALSLLLPSLLISLGTDTAGAAEPLRWSVTPYLWATETKFDLTADGTPIGGGTVNDWLYVRSPIIFDSFISF